MSWFFITLLAPLCWSIVNCFDKYLVDRYFKERGAGALLIWSALIGMILLGPIALIEPNIGNVSFKNALILIGFGILYIAALIPYLHGLQDEEMSLIVPMWQMIPVFIYILGVIFLDEYLNTPQLTGSALIIGGAIGLSLELGQKIKLRLRTFLLMTLSSLIYGIHGIMFKVIALEESFWVTSFWEFVGFSIASVTLLLYGPYRYQFTSSLKKNFWAMITINGVSEFLAMAGQMIMSFMSLTIPVALAYIVNGFQPFFVFLFGLLLTLFFPTVIKENITKKVLLQKSIMIALMFLGVVLLNQ